MPKYHHYWLFCSLYHHDIRVQNNLASFREIYDIKLKPDDITINILCVQTLICQHQGTTVMIFVLIVAQKAILKIHDAAFSPLSFISRGEITKFHCHRSGAHTNQPDVRSCSTITISSARRGLHQNQQIMWMRNKQLRTSRWAFETGRVELLKKIGRGNNCLARTNFFNLRRDHFQAK